MASKAIESAIRELTKTVISMQDKITALEKVVLDQNTLIKKLVSDNEDSSTSVKSVQSKIDVGRIDAQLAPRPMREARIRAASALSGASRTTNSRRNVLPALSSAATEETEVAASSPSAPTTADTSPPTPQLEFVNTAPMNPAQLNKVKTDNGGGDWIEVTQGRSRRAPTNVTRGTAAPGSTLGGLSAAERKSYLHLYFLQIGTTAEQVIAQLKNICPDDICFAEALKSRGDYASFKLTIPTKNVEKYMKPECWAEDVHIKPWHSGFRKPRDQAD